MRSLTLEEKIGQLFFIGISGPELDEATKSLLSEINPAGVCLFARNIKTPEQTRNLLDDIRNISIAEPFLSIDQEGGLVDRLKRLVTPMPAASRFRDPEESAEIGSVAAETLRLLGFNMDFAPVVDVITPEREVTSNGLFSRGFGRSEKDVVELAGAFLRELQAGGVVGCLKHFPGIGASAVDSHEDLPHVDIEEMEFASTDLFPYRELIGSGDARLVMVAHAAYPRLKLQERDQDGRLLPSSLSTNVVTRLLRDELAFDGVAITDDMEMGAIVRNYGIGEACKMAIGAGNDMLAICANESAVREGFTAVLDAVASGEIEESRIDSSLERIEKLRSGLSRPLDFDPSKLSSLSGKIQDLNSRLS